MATGIDPRFILASDLEEYFVDKVTGAPLSAGIVTFYSDVDKFTLKPVYQISGTSPYTYTPLVNPTYLSSVGTFQDALGNNIVPYYYPYTGTPAQDTNDVELYYVTVYSNDGNGNPATKQFDRVAWPNFSGTASSSQANQKNFIPNGQFLAHNTIVSASVPPYETVAWGSFNVLSQEIAPGGWRFNLKSGGTSTFDNSFAAQSLPISGINDDPRFVFNYKCTSVNVLDQVYDLAVEFRNVYTFSSRNADATYPTYTLYFEAQSNSGTSTFDIYRIYNYGSGGSPSVPDEVKIGTVSVLSAYSPFTLTGITFPLPAGTLGTNGDDFVAIAIRGANSSWNARFTSFALMYGDVSISGFPVETTAESFSEGIAGWMPTPNPDGSDLYLPLVLTSSGLTFDHSAVGQIIGKTETAANAVNNELLMDGSAYITSAYSSLGIPYSRLANYLIANSPAMTIGTSTIPAATIPLYGTGANFVTILKNTDPTKFDLNMNTTDGANTVANGTSGFTHTSADPLYVFTVTGVPTASLYFTFTPNTGGAKVYNVWYSVDGVGTPPVAPTGANIEVELVTGDTIATTITKTLTAVNQYQFMILDARGYFWRGLDTGTSVDPDSATRTIQGITDNGVAVAGANLGSYEVDMFKAHVHDQGTLAVTIIPDTLAVIGAADAAGGGSTKAVAQGVTASILGDVGSTGGTETRSVNLALNWFIKY